MDRLFHHESLPGDSICPKRQRRHRPDLVEAMCVLSIVSNKHQNISLISYQKIYLINRISGTSDIK